MEMNVRALTGFFRLQLSCDAPPQPPPSEPLLTSSLALFRSFTLATSTWEDLERKRLAAELVPLTEEEIADGAENSEHQRQVKIVYLVRHAEGYHNQAERELGVTRWEAVEAKQEAYLDADLTAFGISDAKRNGAPAVEGELQRGMPPVQRVVVSPLSRAIQTAELFFPPDQRTSGPFVAIESCRETLGVHTCDKRRPLSEIRSKFPDVDFSRIQDEEDVLWQPDHRETDDELRERAREFLVELVREVPERHVAVVTHSGFISAAWSLFHPDMVLKPANCEVVPLALEFI